RDPGPAAQGAVVAGRAAGAHRRGAGHPGGTDDRGQHSPVVRAGLERRATAARGPGPARAAGAAGAARRSQPAGGAPALADRLDPAGAGADVPHRGAAGAARPRGRARSRAAAGRGGRSPGNGAVRPPRADRRPGRREERRDDGPEMTEQVRVGELTFDVRVGGPIDGAAVMLLHGFPENASMWSGVEPALHAAGLRTIAPDQRGYSPGARPDGVEAYSMHRLVADALGLLDAYGLARVHVVGHDWGAAVGWNLAGRHPDRVATLTAISVPHPAAPGRARRRAAGRRGPAAAVGLHSGV